MANIQNVRKDIVWVGADDRRLELFENIYPFPNGVSYNSYLILDGKTALMYAARNPTSDIVKILLKYGADVRAVDKNGHTAIWWTQYNEKGDKEKIIRILKGNPSVQDAMPDAAFLELCKSIVF